MAARFRVDLRSDTVSVPSLGMRNAIAHAEVGDDVYGEDPTVNTLEQRVAALLGFESSLFMVSGTMSNGVAARVLAEPGDEVLCGTSSHMYVYEGAQCAMNGGIQLHRMDEGPDGLPPREAVEAALSRGGDVHFAPRTLLCLENTHNILGGLMLPTKGVRDLQEMASARGVRLYLDGARLWHSAAALRVPMADLTSGFDMVSVCFSKAMGCPVGSVLAGSRDLVQRARWFRKRHGGGMRQAGILAAACIYALDHNLSQIEQTHRWAKSLARAAASSAIFEVDPEKVDTNIVILRTPGVSSTSVVSMLGGTGIGCLAVSPDSIRLVTHLSLTDRDIKFAADTLAAFGG
jgi:threonine aldolase